MKKLITILCLLIAVSAIALITRCKTGQTGKQPTDTTITAVDLPTNIVPGFNFPEDSSTIYNWVKGTPPDTVSMLNHAWGIWAGLTAQSGQTFGSDSLLVYQTWLGIGGIQNLIFNNITSNKGMRTHTSPVLLSKPRQFFDAIKFASKKLKAIPFVDTNFIQWVAVAYNPQAVSHVVSNSLFKASVIDSLQRNHIGSIPQFPPNALTIKPVYLIAKPGDKAVRIPVWPGPRTTPNGFPPQSWNNYVWVDLSGKVVPSGRHLKPADSTANAAQILAATCSVNDFIHFKLDSNMAAYMNQQQGVQGIVAKAGDVALLVAMHVTTKEINNWTWETYYWAPDPDNPLEPSSPVAAKLRPAQLKGASRHYAVGVAYAMVQPNQPISGGTNKGASPIFTYNPYLEAGFGPATFNLSNQLNPNFKYGIQTNCMSCHALADNAKTDNSFYSADQYISLNDTAIFKNYVRYDFAWSFQVGVEKDFSKLKESRFEKLK
ncbi:hypothetical protein MUY27_17315 [Mucilaginibacter sp. RS28]|uniref:Cytochrome c domain-containing protein n=1 Tax=Mucilaginibacter straminoryzae TaxID=2932774 RepID=A0A9X1X5I5_9SPHI|nr:hypothetical protein [Mucilaginibacter straminoryzae]MCJ8211482.1 hypothetical protein [Mucilaginibacter straminoryzae]